MKRHLFDALEKTVDFLFLGRIILLALNLARPRLAAPPGASTRPARGMSGFGIPQVPGHAMHEKGLQRQIAVGTLVNSQQRRALAVSQLNRWSTAGQPLVNRTFCSSTVLNRISFVRACEETFRTVVYGTLGGSRDGCLRGRPKCRNLGLPSFAPPHHPLCTAPTRPARCVSGFWTRQVSGFWTRQVLDTRATSGF